MRTFIDLLHRLCAISLIINSIRSNRLNTFADKPRFLDLFGAFIAEQFKLKERFRTIFITGLLSEIKALPLTLLRCLPGSKHVSQSC